MRAVINANTRGSGSLYTSAAVFLLGSVALVVNSGYSYGAALLCLGGVFALFHKSSVDWDRRDFWILAVIVGFGIVGILEATIHGGGSREFDKPVRFVLAAVALVLVRKYPPRLIWLWAGLAMGGILSACWSGYQKMFLDVDRAGGFTFVIQYGNIAMLTGMLCLAGLGWSRKQNHANFWTTFLVFGAIGGVLASLLSGSRGGWVGLPLLLVVLYKAYRDLLPPRIWAGGVAAVCIVMMTVYAVPQFGVQERIHEAISDIQLFREGDSKTSVGARFEMWKGAGKLFLQKPIFGWGDSNYAEAMRALVEQEEAHPIVSRYGHAHNEILDNAAKRGLIGIFALIALYFVPIGLFSRGLHSVDLTVRSVATAGTLLPVAYIDFGLSQAFFAHNSGVMIYAFWLVVLWGCYRNASSNPVARKEQLEGHA